MKACVTLLILSFFFISVMYLELDHDMASLLNERVKNALNRATHDASLQLDMEALSLGMTAFDQERALSVFKDTLATNLGLNPVTLKPLEGTIFTSEAAIEYIEFLDDKDTISYPYLYQNNTYKITKIIKGPAVIAVISIEKPILATLSSQLRYRKWSVYEYPSPKTL